MYNSYSALNLLGGMLYTMILLAIAYFVLKIVANWKIFEKAGQPGWASIVPFYSNYIEFNIYWGNGWLFLIPVVLSLLSGIPLLGQSVPGCCSHHRCYYQLQESCCVR